MTDDTKAKENKGEKPKSPGSGLGEGGLSSLDVHLGQRSNSNQAIARTAHLEASMTQSILNASANHTPDRGFLFGAVKGATNAGARLFTDPVSMVATSEARSATLSGLGNLFTNTGGVLREAGKSINETLKTGRGDEIGGLFGATVLNAGVAYTAFKGLGGAGAAARETSQFSELSAAARFERTVAARTEMLASVDRNLASATSGLGKTAVRDAHTFAEAAMRQSVQGAAAGLEQGASIFDDVIRGPGVRGAELRTVAGRPSLPEVHVAQPPVSPKVPKGGVPLEGGAPAVSRGGMVQPLDEAAATFVRKLDEPAAVALNHADDALAHADDAARAGLREQSQRISTGTTNLGAATEGSLAEQLTRQIVQQGDNAAGYGQRVIAETEEAVGGVRRLVDGADGAVARGGTGVAREGGNISAQVDNAAAAGVRQVDNTLAQELRPITEAGARTKPFIQEGQFASTRGQLVRQLDDLGVEAGQSRRILDSLDNYARNPNPANYSRLTEQLDDLAKPATNTATREAATAGRGGLSMAERDVAQVRRMVDDAIGRETTAGVRASAAEGRPIAAVEQPRVIEPQRGGAPAERGGTAPAERGGTAPAERGGTAPAERGGTAPAERGGTAPERGGTAPAERGGTAPAERGGTAPAERGGTAPAERGGTAPAERGGAAPAERGVAAPAERGGAPEVQRGTAETRGITEPVRPVEQTTWGRTQEAITRNLDDMRDVARQSGKSQVVDDLQTAIAKYADEPTHANLNKLNNALRETEAASPSLARQTGEIRQSLQSHMVPEHAVVSRLDAAATTQAGQRAVRTLSDDIAKSAERMRGQTSEVIAQETADLNRRIANQLRREMNHADDAMRLSPQEAVNMRRTVLNYTDDAERMGARALRERATVPTKPDAPTVIRSGEGTAPSTVRRGSESAAVNETSRSAAQNSRLIDVANRTDDFVNARTNFSQQVRDRIAQIENPAARINLEAQLQTYEVNVQRLSQTETRIGEYFGRRAVANEINGLEKALRSAGVEDVGFVRTQARAVDTAMDSLRQATQKASIGDSWFSPVRDFVQRHAIIGRPIDFLSNSPWAHAAYMGLGAFQLGHGLKQAIDAAERDLVRQNNAAASDGTRAAAAGNATARGDERTAQASADTRATASNGTSSERTATGAEARNTSAIEARTAQSTAAGADIGSIAKSASVAGSTYVARESANSDTSRVAPAEQTSSAHAPQISTMSAEAGSTMPKAGEAAQGAEAPAVQRVSDSSVEGAAATAVAAGAQRSISHAMFSVPMTSEERKQANRMRFGVDGIDWDYSLRGPGTPTPTDAPKATLSTPVNNLGFRTNITDIPERERLTNPVFDYQRSTRYTPSNLLRNDGIWMSSSAMGSEGRRYGTNPSNSTGAAPQGKFEARYGYLNQAANALKNTLGSATASGSENNEAVNPDRSGAAAPQQPPNRANVVAGTAQVANAAAGNNDPAGIMPNATTSASTPNIQSEDAEPAVQV